MRDSFAIAMAFLVTTALLGGVAGTAAGAQPTIATDGPTAGAQPAVGAAGATGPAQTGDACGFPLNALTRPGDGPAGGAAQAQHDAWLIYTSSRPRDP